jgi:hypothetical protein
MTAAEVVEAGESEFCHIYCGIRGTVNVFCGTPVEDSSECTHAKDHHGLCDYVCIVCLEMVEHAVRIDRCPVCGHTHRDHDV